MPSLLVTALVLICSGPMTHLAHASCKGVLLSQGHLSLTDSALASAESLQSAFEEIALMAIYNDAVGRNNPSGLNEILELEFEKKRRELLNLVLIAGLMTEEQFEDRLGHEVHLRQNRQREQAFTNFKQSVAVAKKQVDGSQALFGRIEKGSFLGGASEGKSPITISKSFALMITPVTEKIWKEILQMARQRFGNKYERLEQDSKYQYGGVFPMTNVSKLNIQKWIEALNELSEVDFPGLYQLIPKHQKGDVYRLPSEVEWEFVARKRGAVTEAYSFPMEQMNDYAWYWDNSGKKVQPVATTNEPFIVDDSDFFDLFGNVCEIVLDITDRDQFFGPYPSGVDPLATQGDSSITKGGCCLNPADFMKPGQRSLGCPSLSDNLTGFRLLRERAD